MTDRLENAVVELERRKITKEERIKAQKAMEALELSKNGAGAGAGVGAGAGSAQGPSKEDVAFIVSDATRHEGKRERKEGSRD